MYIAITGHQPPLLGGYSEEVQNSLKELARDWMIENKPKEIISGMAAGWDMACATVATELEIPLTAVLAYAGQGLNWPNEALKEFKFLLDKATLVHIMPTNRSGNRWTIRDQWVIDRGDSVLALWSGVQSGTSQAVDYAKIANKPIFNLWDKWEQKQNLYSMK